MKGGARTALAVAAGYFLGRSKKMRLALMLAAAGATGRLGTPGELLQRGTKMLASSPEVAKIAEDLRGELFDALKAAAVTAASSRIDSLSDRLQEAGGERLREAGSDLREAGSEVRETGSERLREAGRPAEAVDEISRRARGRGGGRSGEAEDEEYPEGDEDRAAAAESEEEPEPAPRQRHASTERRPHRVSRDEGERSDDDDRAGRRGTVGAGTGRAPIRRTRR
jgi:hypothetical protein